MGKSIILCTSLLILSLVIGAFGCAGEKAPAPTATPTPAVTPTPTPTPTPSSTPTPPKLTALTNIEYINIESLLLQELMQSANDCTAEIRDASSLITEGYYASGLTAIEDAFSKYAQQTTSILTRWDAVIPPLVFADAHECYSNCFEEQIRLCETAASCLHSGDMNCVESIGASTEELTATCDDCEAILNSTLDSLAPTPIPTPAL
jgi:hypothetical protein